MDSQIILQGGMPVPVKHWAFTVDDYMRMFEAGILTEDDRVELIDGEIIEMSPIGDAHAGCVKKGNALFHRLIGGRSEERRVGKECRGQGGRGGSRVTEAM